MTTALTKEQQTKILTPNVRRLLAALRGEARVVGGAVRDALLDRAVGDIDLATTLPPDQVMEILAKNGIKTVPTGLSHGTVTAIVEHVGYEITTLRRDVETDGRHATVAFTDDWCEDAARRDFTLNALYVDADGTLYDYVDGAEDAKAGRVRFIGDAHARIREDVLRILRFFRFTASFGKGDADNYGLAACRDLANLIPNLSIERITREFMKLLEAENPLPALQLMSDCGVMKYLLPEGADLKHLRNLLNTEKTHDAKPAALVRFAALLPEDESLVYTVAARFKLSNRDAETLCALSGLPKFLRDNFAPVALRRLIYQYGAEKCRNAALLIGGNIAEALLLIDTWTVPVFPIRGEDIVKLSFPAGPRIGEILKATEKWWIDGDFSADRALCLRQAYVYGKNP
jgi:poly(A) polymerase